MVQTYTHEFDSKFFKGKVTIKKGLFIDGQWVDPVEGDMIEYSSLTLHLPANGKTITTVPGGGAKDVDIAVKAARKAYKTSWGLKVPGSERGRILGKFADLLEKHTDALASLEALNVGKPFLAAKSDLAGCVGLVRYYAGWADKIHGKTIETTEKKMAYTRQEPWGVVGAILPWNVPLLMAMMKLGPALATGNAIIIKTSELTPFTALYAADLLNEAGVPPGVVNIVNGYGMVSTHTFGLNGFLLLTRPLPGNTAGAAISLHHDINKISFTGSTLTGRKILKAAAESNMKAVTLELGGKSPTIIFDDANVDQAIKWAAGGVFYNMGQACIAGSRIYVQEGIHDRFLEGISKHAESMANATGSPFNEGTLHGPQVSQTQYDRVMGYINSGKSEGAKIHIGGERHGEEGYFIKPTVIVDAQASMKIMREEIFGPLISVVDPTNGKTITTVPGGGAKDVDIAVKAARKAYNTSWGLKVPGSERGRILGKFADLLEKHIDALASLEALNVGKPFLAAKSDLAGCVGLVRYYAGWADKIHGKTIETTEKKMAYTRQEPWGVVGAILPWNVPLLMAMMKLGPALATGNAIIIKTSELTPFTALYAADLLNEAGVPPGVVNIVNGYGNTAGAAISLHHDINKISFTGSTLTGRKILKAAAESNMKAVTLELGGKSPTIIFDDANVDQAIKWAAGGVFYNMGQACIAGSRIYVQEGIHDRFLEGISKHAESMANATGSPFNEGTLHGPQVSQTQYDRVMGYINSGKSEGAKIHIGGERHGEEGYFIKPTVIVDAQASMKIMREEIFGPVCSVVKFKTEEEVTEWANDTTYGLAANILTENSSRAIRMANALQAGSVFVNCTATMAVEINVPFGGYKQSGIGREFGQEALDTYTQTKAIHINIGQVL
ncbi:Aldehyde dehydrogenase [Leucoagaricus sp. SymC.cos]|nr:Aldehyde dehydrogenase [Leucoagaricus sp. SymC.cos]